MLVQRQPITRSRINRKLKISSPQSTFFTVNREITTKVLVCCVSTATNERCMQEQIKPHHHCSFQKLVLPQTTSKNQTMRKKKTPISPPRQLFQDLDRRAGLWVDSGTEVLGDIMYNEHNDDEFEINIQLLGRRCGLPRKKPQRKLSKKKSIKLNIR